MQSFGKSVVTAALIMLAYGSLLGMWFLLVYIGKVDANSFVDKLWTLIVGLGSALAYFFGHRNGSASSTDNQPTEIAPTIVEVPRGPTIETK